MEPPRGSEVKSYSQNLKEGDRVAFVGGWHDIVGVGDIGIIEKVVTEEEKELYQRNWGGDKDYKYQVCFNGTVLMVSEEDVVPLSIALLLQL